tara:strand:- start:8488 stop:8658 length:171 start_codon:yes stop_codon:yes gene_type:complete
MKPQNNGYLPQSTKNQTPTIKSFFTNKKEMLPKDGRSVHKEKFKQELKNRRSKITK